MATILKVHGTFASGPEEGDKWWQRGSECCSHVGELVEAEDGHLKIEQVVWDGLNSERSRQAAAAKLLDRMGELEKAGEPYCVVGHSHGGSVISAALLRAAFYKKPMVKLSRWITVGTPFIDAKSASLMLFRLGTVGKTLALSIWTGLLGLFAFVLLTDPDTASFRWVTLGVIALSVAAISYPILWLLARNRLYWHHAKIQDRARQAFADRWFSLRHEDDEAVQGLGAFQSIKHPIFARDFAVAPLSKLSIVLVPLIIAGLLLLMSQTKEGKARIEQIAPHQSASQPASPPAKVESAGQKPQSNQDNAPANSSPADSKDEDTALPRWAATLIGVFGFALILGGFIGFTLVIVYLLNLTARPTSRALSYGLNRLTWSQLRSSSLGSDIDGESGRYARASPIWLHTQRPPLPRPLATEISTVSDAAAGNSIAKFRAALSELGFYRLEQGGKDALNAFLTGDELIHTTYFKIPRFRKLLAYSIAQSPGFRPSAALRNDPDFPLIEQWYRELTAPPQEAAVPSVAAPQAAPALPI